MNLFARMPLHDVISKSICSSCLRSLRMSRAAQTGLQNRKRGIHSSSKLLEDSQPSQAQPLGDFYEDLLAAPLPRDENIHSHLPTFVQSGDQSKEARAARLFGTIQGSGYERRAAEPNATWRTVNGVPVPPRPAEPDNCCMSGCVHCVWDDYRDDLEEWAMRSHRAQMKSQDRGTRTNSKIDMHRPEVAAASSSMDDDGGGSESLWNSPSTAGAEEDLFAGIPVGIREFMNVEKKIRERKRARKAKEKTR